MLNRIGILAAGALLVFSSTRRAEVNAAGSQQGRYRGDRRSSDRNGAGPRAHRRGPHEVVATTDGKLAVASNYGTGQIAGPHALGDRHREPQGDPPRGRRATDASAWAVRLRRKSVFHRRRQQGDRALRSRNQSRRLAVEHRPGRHPHGRNEQGSQPDLHVQHRLRLRSRSSRARARTGTAPLCRSAAARKASTFHPMARNSGPPTPATAQFQSSTSPRGKLSQRFRTERKRANRLKFTPDGRRVLDFRHHDRRPDRWSMSPPASKSSGSHLGSSLAGILVEPDGARAYVAATADNFVAVVDLKTLEVSRPHLDRQRSGRNGLDRRALNGDHTLTWPWP